MSGVVSAMALTFVNVATCPSVELTGTNSVNGASVLKIAAIDDGYSLNLAKIYEGTVKIKRWQYLFRPFQENGYEAVLAEPAQIEVRSARTGQRTMLDLAQLFVAEVRGRDFHGVEVIFEDYKVLSYSCTVNWAAIK